MRAASLKCAGTEGSLQVANVPKPTLEKHQLLIRVISCALSETDTKVRSGHFEEFATYPLTPGYQIVGIVDELGEEAENFSRGQTVAAILPIDTVSGGCAEFCLVNFFDAFLLPPSAKPEEIVVSLASGLRALSALHYNLRIVAGDTVVIFDGASVNGYIAIQFAKSMGAKVFTTVHTAEEEKYLAGLPQSIEKIIDCSADNFVDVILRETAGMGVDGLLGMPPNAATKRCAENVRVGNESESEGDGQLSLILDGIDALATHGRWVAPFDDLYLSPPLSRLLHLKSISLSFFNDQAWSLARSQHGRYHHMLREIISKVSSAEILPPKNILRFPLEQIREAHRRLGSERIAAVVVEMDSSSTE